MHYKTPALSFDVDGVENFLSATGGKHIGKQEIELKKMKLKTGRKLLPWIISKNNYRKVKYI